MKMKRIIIILASFLSFVSANAQNQHLLDSLMKVILEGKKDTNMVNALNEYAWEIKTGQAQKSKDYATRALALAKKLDYNQGIAAAYNTMGGLHYFVQNYDSAIAMYNKAYESYKIIGHNRGISSVTSNIGIIYNEKGDYSKALEYHKIALDTRLESDNKNDIAGSYNNIGNLYNQTGDYDLAADNFMKALKIYEESGDKYGLGAAFYNMGVLHYYQGNYKEGMEYCIKSLDARKEADDKYGVAYCYILMGAIYVNQKEYEKAIFSYQSSLEMEYILGDKLGIASNLLNLANAYNEMGKYDDAFNKMQEASLAFQAIENNKMETELILNMAEIRGNQKKYKEALALAETALQKAMKYGIKAEVLFAYIGMAEYHEALGDFRQAHQYLKLGLGWKDSLMTEQKAEQIREMESKYENEKKELQIENLNKEKALQNAEIEKQEEQMKRKNLILYFAFAAILMILVFSVLIYRQFREKKKANILLAEQNEEIRQKNEEITAQNDAILEQNEQIKQQNEEIEAQRDEIQEQKDQIEGINKEMTDSIHYAKRIQSAILPTTELTSKHLPEHFVFFKPKDIVSGDFYWLTHVEGRTIVAVADCTGHGVPGAFMSMLGAAFLNEIVNKEYITHTGVILRRLRKEVVKALQQKGEMGEQKDGMDISLVSINTSDNRISFSGANNPLYVIRSSSLPEIDTEIKLSEGSNTLYEIKGDKMPIAIYDRMDKFSTTEFTALEGDCLYMFSDGFADQFGGPKGRKFMYKSFKKLLLSASTEEMTVQGEILETSLAKWLKDAPFAIEQVDDICVLGFRHTKKSESGSSPQEDLA